MPSSSPVRRAVTGLTAALSITCTPGGAQAPSAYDPRAADFMVVDCLLPGQLRRLGTRSTYLSARRPVRAAAHDCRIRGGEYVEYDRADLKSALGAWLPQAEAGDVEAQGIVGEIYERGLGVAADYGAAAKWYRLAVDSYARAAGMPSGIEFDIRPPAPAAPVAVVAPDPAELDRLRQAAEISQREANNLRAAATQREAELQALRDEIARRRGNEEALTAQLVTREAEIDRLRAASDRRQKDADEAAAAQTRALAEARSAAQSAAAQAQAAIAEQRTRLASLEQSAAQKLLSAPELTLVEPQLARTRDIVPVAASRSREREIVGRVASPAGLTALT